jgi:peptidoglycan/LPS O-acetylase OafA/YrhL
MDPIKRTLNLVTGAFALAAVVAVAVLTGLDLGTPERPDLEDGAVLATAVLGGIGLLIALVWTARSGERHADPNRLMLGYVTRLAITEVGALLGILGLFLTGSTAAPYLGLALFLLSLAVLAAGLRRIG